MKNPYISAIMQSIQAAKTGFQEGSAAKIAPGIDAAMMAHNLAMRNKEYEAYTGILKEDAGEAISCVGHIGKVGMRQTDKEIIKMMLE